LHAANETEFTHTQKERIGIKERSIKMVKNKMTCDACGSASAPEESRFCPDCGSSLAVESEDTNTMDTPMATAVPISAVLPTPNDDLLSSISKPSSSHTTMNGAMYFKHPSPEMLARANKREASLGILFVETTERKGKFTVPQSIDVLCVLRGSTIDLSIADFVYPTTTIRVIPSVLSGVKIKVPRGVRVEMQGIGILGGMKGLKTQNIHVGQDGPVLKVQGVTVLGSVVVTVNDSVPPVKVVE
jgi:hypothetical protein